MKITHTRNYREARCSEYPAIGDQLDAIWKALDASGIRLPPETVAVLDSIRSVKKRFPKPNSAIM